MSFTSVVEIVALALDAAGVIAIAGGATAATAWAAAGLFRGGSPSELYGPYRQALGKAILLGLELLVAADIIRTVAVGPTLESVAVLAAVVAIRTFLSFTLEVELEGRWPWQRSEAASPVERGAR